MLPILGSLIPVLACPDTEIPFQTLSVSKIFATLFLHEDVLQSGHRNGVGQRLMSSTTYKKFSRIGWLLRGTVGAPTRPLSGKRDGIEISRGVPIIHGISAFHFYRIHQWTSPQYSPPPWARPICSGIS